MKALTYTVTVDDFDEEEMTLIGMDETLVTVFFDGDKEDRATMSHVTFDNMVQGECWEENGVVDLS